MSNSNTEYERYVRDITAALLRGDGMDTVKVEHNIQVPGLARSHQIDVYWEYRLGGILHRVIINCKRYAKKVTVTDVEALSGVLSDMPGVRGLIATTVGFQRGGVDYAKLHGIGLKVIRPPRDEDWEGLIREVHIDFRFDVPELISTQVQINRAWAESSVKDPEALAFQTISRADQTVVRDLKSGEVSDVVKLWNRAMREHPVEAGQEGHGILKWEDAMLERPGSTPVKIDTIGFHWRIKQGSSETMVVRHDPAAIVRDAIDGTLQFINPEDILSE